jgi:NIPSNAP
MGVRDSQGTLSVIDAASAFEVVELRRYVMQPGRRDDLIALFEREFIEAQEQCGMFPIGHYRDPNDPNSFVWFRAFPRYDDRGEANDAFYGRSEAWRKNRDAANATLIDSDDVLMLHSARPETGFDLRGLSRPPEASVTNGFSRLAVSIFTLEAPPDEAWVATFESHVLPVLQRSAERVAYFVTDDRPNNYPRLPIREGEYAFVVAGVCRTVEALDTWAAGCESWGGPRVLRREMLRLEPAARSILR